MLDGLADVELALAEYFDRRHPSLQAAALAIFAGMNSVRIVAYIPQILKAARDSNGASAISCTTWSIFLASNAATLLYATVCLADLVMAAVFLGNGLACLTILLCAWGNRRRFLRRARKRS